MNEIHLAPDFIDRVISAFGRVAGIFHPDYLLFIGLAIVPVLIWLYIFFRHQRENKLITTLTFLAGMLAVVPIFIFQHEITRIESWIEGAIWSSLGVIALTGLWVGFYEETAKIWIVKITDRKLFRNIDDAIQLSIVVALGFAFIENVLYFRSIWDNPLIGNFWFYFTFRSLGSMFLHILASGIFGYYYGVAHFAKPVLQDKLSAGKKFIFTKWIHRLLHLKSETVFYQEKVFEGLLIAASLHATFDFLMGMSQHFADEGSALGTKFWLLLAVPFLVSGYFWLTYLLDQKENHKAYKEVEDRKDVLEKK